MVGQETARNGRTQPDSSHITNELATLGLKLVTTPADGDCAYHAFSHQMKQHRRIYVNRANLRQYFHSMALDHFDDITDLVPSVTRAEVNAGTWNSDLGDILIIMLGQWLQCKVRIIHEGYTWTSTDSVGRKSKDEPYFTFVCSGFHYQSTELASKV